MSNQGLPKRYVDILSCLSSGEFRMSVEVKDRLLEIDDKYSGLSIRGIGAGLGALSRSGYVDRQIGIGRAFCYRLAQRGMAVVSPTRNKIIQEELDLGLDNQTAGESFTSALERSFDKVFSRIDNDRAGERMIPMFLVRESVLKDVLIGLSKNGVHVYDDRSAAMSIQVSSLSNDLDTAISTAAALEKELNDIKARVPAKILKAYVEE